MGITIARLQKLVDGKAPWSVFQDRRPSRIWTGHFPVPARGRVFGFLVRSPTAPKRHGGKAKWEVPNEQPPTRKPSHRFVYPHGPWWSLGRFSRLPVLVTWNVAGRAKSTVRATTQPCGTYWTRWRLHRPNPLYRRNSRCGDTVMCVSPARTRAISPPTLPRHGLSCLLNGRQHVRHCRLQPVI